MPYIDYGARMYDPESGIWHGVDQLSEQTPQISPYAFCGNNPIRHIDTDGRKWVDAKGNAVWNNGGWTKYASNNQMRAGIALRASETGRGQFKKLVNSDAKIQVVVNTTDNKGTKLIHFIAFFFVLNAKEHKPKRLII